MAESDKMVREFLRCSVTVIILSLIPRLEAAKKDILNFDDDDRKTRAVAELTGSCILREGRPLVVSDKLSDELVKYLHRSESSSITSLASSKLSVEDWYSAGLKNKELYYGRHLYRFLWKSSGFLAAASSPPNLKEQLDNLKDSRWWNAAGFFILIEDDSPDSESCSNAYKFLSMAWRYGLLSSIFLCQEQDGSLSVYAYDPYGNSPPRSWLKNREIKGQQGYPWNLFKWEKYDGRRHKCEDIFFDKTTSLNGYPIPTNAVSLAPFLYFRRNETSITEYRGEDGWVMRDVWNFLNASIVNVPLPDKDAMVGWVGNDGSFHGNLIEINSGKVDLGLNSMILQPTWKVATTYPHATVNLCFVTRSRGTIPWLIGLAFVFDKWTMTCAAVTFLLATVIFGYFDKRRFFSAFLNTLRVFVSTSFIRPPASTNLRMIMCFVFLMPIVSYSTYQGKILSLIQNPLHYAEIDLLEDVITAGFHFEGPGLVKKLMLSKYIRDNFIATSDFDGCLLKSYNREPVACINYCFSIFVKTSYYRSLHVGQQKSGYYQNRYVAKPDWPLVDRFNVVVRRIVEAGLPEFYRRLSRYEKTASRSSDSDDSDAVVLHLHELRYVFILLGIGWGCGTLAFIGELIFSRMKRPKVSKTRVDPLASTPRAFQVSRLVNRAKD